MLPLKNIIKLDRNTKRNLYLQLCDQIIGLIKSGKLAPSSKLPGSRKLAEDISIHRKTVVAAYEELTLQGWIQAIPAKGTYVTSTLPVINPKEFMAASNESKNPKEISDFAFTTRPHLIRKKLEIPSERVIEINDGCPDHRLAPIDEITKTYRDMAKKTHHNVLLAYGSLYGNIALRKALVTHLNHTRGLQITTDNILITRGSQMGIYLASQLLLSDGGRIVVGNTNYMTANDTFTEAKGIIKQIPIDHQGLDTKQLEAYCKTKKIKAVYVTSHHHHPTTITLSAQRRMHLLQLAQQYNFAIIEDDYDYDFHYSNAPILPLASNDNLGNVIYTGGITKIIAPAIRIGYLVAPKDFIDEAARLRRIIDRQGDQLLEQTLAHIISSGDLQRHSNKALRIYKKRRDLFCYLLKEKLGAYFEFEIPKGGMAIWVRLHPRYHWDDIYQKAKKMDVLFTSDWKRYDINNDKHNGIRMGFASLNEQEIHLAIDRLVKVFDMID